jgi:hypothetical protein
MVGDIGCFVDTAINHHTNALIAWPIVAAIQETAVVNPTPHPVEVPAGSAMDVVLPDGPELDAVVKKFTVIDSVAFGGFWIVQPCATSPAANNVCDTPPAASVSDRLGVVGV